MKDKNPGRFLIPKETVAKALRAQGVLTEELVQWLTDTHYMVWELKQKIEDLEGELREAGINI